MCIPTGWSKNLKIISEWSILFLNGRLVPEPKIKKVMFHDANFTKTQTRGQIERKDRPSLEITQLFALHDGTKDNGIIGTQERNNYV